MTEERNVELTEDEILMTRSMLQKALTTPNAPVATTILAKLSAALPESPESILTMRNRRKLLGNIAGMHTELPTTLEPQPTTAAPVPSAYNEEVVEDLQPIAASPNNDLNKTETILAMIRGVNLPKINFFQHLLQKFRPAARL